MAKKASMSTRIVCLAIVLGIAFCLGSAFRPATEVRAGVRETTPKQHFLAGSERSIPILMEISETLEQIDARLETIEKTVTEAARQPADR
jgi:hypothetical protein